MRKLEVMVNVSIIATCLAIVGTLAVRFWVPGPTVAASASKASLAPDSTVLQAGDTLTNVDGLELSDADRTLLMFWRSGCRYCAESLPFYQRLSQEIRSSKSGKVRVVVVTSDPVGVADRYLKENSLDAARIVHQSADDRRQMKIVGTPTLVLVDRSGHVEQVWLGKLDSAGESAVLGGLFPKG